MLKIDICLLSCLYLQIHTSLINGRPSADDLSPELLEFTSAQYIRLRLQRIRTLNADLMTLSRRDPKDLDPIVTRRVSPRQCSWALWKLFCLKEIDFSSKVGLFSYFAEDHYICFLKNAAFKLGSHGSDMAPPVPSPASYNAIM